ncbi:MAG TPA: DUF4145 domain-containing protein [Terriglobales bacterium]
MPLSWRKCKSSQFSRLHTICSDLSGRIWRFFGRIGQSRWLPSVPRTRSTENLFLGAFVPTAVKGPFLSNRRTLQDTATKILSALEASCIKEGADPQLRIEKKIDWLSSKQTITPGLAEMAHTIRLAGNRGAHPPDDPGADAPITEEEADAVIEFTRQFFDHVYVMPARRAKFNFSRQRGKNQP